MRPSIPLYKMVTRGAPPQWVIPSAVVDLDFRARRYWWGGKARSESEFVTFTGGTFLNGLVLDGVAANHDITIASADIGLLGALQLHASFTPASVAGVMQAAGIDDGTASNVFVVGTNTTTARVLLVTATVTQATLDKATAVSAGVRVTVGGQFGTNAIRQSVDGANAAAADTSATIFTPVYLRVGERGGGSNPFNGTIHRVVGFNGVKTQAAMNIDNALVHAA